MNINEFYPVRVRQRRRHHHRTVPLARTTTTAAASEQAAFNASHLRASVSVAFDAGVFVCLCFVRFPACFASKTSCDGKTELSGLETMKLTLCSRPQISKWNSLFA